MTLCGATVRALYMQRQCVSSEHGPGIREHPARALVATTSPSRRACPGEKQNASRIARKGFAAHAAAPASRSQQQQRPGLVAASPRNSHEDEGRPRTAEHCFARGVPPFGSDG